jgi:hypothetical protein
MIAQSVRHAAHDHARTPGEAPLRTRTPLVPPQDGHGLTSAGLVTVDGPCSIIGALTGPPPGSPAPPQRSGRR